MADREPGLLQVRRGAGDPWKIGVICILLNLSSYKQVEPVLTPLFRYAPIAEAMVAAPLQDLSDIIHRIGLQATKARRLIEFSEDTINGVPFEDRRGIGTYAADCHALLCLGDVHRPGVKDYALKRWQDWAIREQGRIQNDTMTEARR